MRHAWVLVAVATALAMGALGCLLGFVVGMVLF